MKTKLELMIVFMSTLGIITLFCTQFTIFVMPPIGTLSSSSETVLITRLDESRFIDSSDAMCQRANGVVNPICRGRVVGNVTQNAKVLAKFPYVDWFYLISTKGVRY